MKRRVLTVVLLVLLAAIGLVPAALADDDDDGGGAATPTTVTFGSSPAWGGQHVCLNDTSPPGCPPDATRYGYPGPGWFAGPRLHGSNWIWLSGVTGATRPAENATATFSQTFQLNGTPTSGQICLAADDYAEARVNGTLVGTVGSTLIPAQSTVAQNTFTCFPFTPQQGSNTITVFGQNGPGFFAACTNCTYQQHPAGVAFYGELTFVPAGDDDGDDDDGDDDGGDDDGGTGGGGDDDDGGDG